jgi:CheY-like chemotaxis protein
MLSARPPLTLTKSKQARMHRERFLNPKPLDPSEIKGPSLVIGLVENMMALDPTKRFQTPAQLLDAIKHARAQVAALEGNTAGVTKVAPTLFVVETDERLQDAFRDKLRQLGYKVLIAGDPSRAVDRFRQQPYHGLIVDVGTTDKDGVRAFNAVMERARSLAMPCHGFILLNTDQEDVAARLDPDYKVTVLTRPLKMGHLLKALQKKIPTAGGNGDLPAG